MIYINWLKLCLIYETLSGEEIKNLILKNIQPKRATTDEDDKNTEKNLQH